MVVKRQPDNAEALKVEQGKEWGSVLSVYLQHPSGDHPPHEGLDVLLDAFEIGILRQEPLLDGQQALQDSVIAQEVRVRTSSDVGVPFEAEQLHGARLSDSGRETRRRRRRSGRISLSVGKAAVRGKNAKGDGRKVLSRHKKRLQGSVRVVLPLLSLLRTFSSLPTVLLYFHPPGQIRRISSLPFMRH